jgi:uncharacterized membrane protein YtjA (UPF0391 family)
MIRASLSFFAVAIIAYILGANQIAGLSVEIGRVLLIVFLGLAVLSYIISILTDKKVRTRP